MKWRNYWRWSGVLALLLFWPTLGAAATIAAGAWHSLGIRADSPVLGWGRNDFGQCRVPRKDIFPLLMLSG